MSDRAVPNLPSRSFDATIAFYGAFGFAPTFRDEGWLILARGTVELEFHPDPDIDPASTASRCSVRVADVDELHRAIVRAGVPEATSGFPRTHPVRREASGLRIGHLIDLDGSQLALIEDAGD